MPQDHNRNSLDTIHIERLELDCIIGINPWERLSKQRITLDILLGVDLSAAGASDAIDDTVDYKTITKKITAEVEASSYGLVEALASRIADICLENPLVEHSEVTLRKPGAVRNTAAVGVTIRRSRESQS